MTLTHKKDVSHFENIIGTVIDTPYKNYHFNIFENIQRWIKSAKTKSVWSNRALYDNVVLKGCYPLHPITIWILSNMSGWLQQRSSITFAEEMFSSISGNEIIPGKLKYIYPVDIIDSEIFHEMVNAEEKGLQQSQYCLLYRDIMLKHGDKLSDDEKRVIKAILIINIGKFDFSDKDSAVSSLRYCSGMPLEEVGKIAEKLEVMQGIVQYDDTVKKFDLIAEGNGFNEFKREFLKRRIQLRNFNGISECDSVVNDILDLNTPVDTQFGVERNINSTEWKFSKRLIDIVDFDEAYGNMLITILDKAIDGETPRGILVYLYCTSVTYFETNRVVEIIKSKQLYEYPLLFLLINDTEGELVEALKIRDTLKLFPTAERQRFERFIVDQERKSIRKIAKLFNAFSAERYIVSQNGVEKTEQRIAAVCNNIFCNIYTYTIPFLFDGFEKKLTASIKRYLNDICQRLYDNTLTNIQSYQSLAPDIKNRVKAVLSTQAKDSWMVFDNNCILCEPQNERLIHLYNEIVNELESEEIKKGNAIFKKYMYPPYGMNTYSLSLLIIYVISYNGRKIYTYLNGNRIKSSQFAQEIFKDSKIQFDTLLRMGFQKLNNANENPILELCNRIITNVNVENCQQYKIQLNNLLSEEDISSDIDGKLSSAKMKLKDGERLFNQIYDDLKQANEILNENTVNFQLIKFIRLYALIQNHIGRIDNYSDYVYSKEYTDKCDALLSQANSLLDKCAYSSIQKLFCNITQLSQLKNVYKKVADTLNEIGKNNLSEAISERLIVIERELCSKQKYEQTMAKFEQEVIFCNNTSGITLKVCSENLEKMQTWKAYFDQIKDLGEDTKNEVFEKIDKAVLNLEKRVSDINDQLIRLYTTIKSISSQTQFSHLKVEIDRLIKLEIPFDEQKKLIDWLQQIDDFNAIFANDRPGRHELIEIKQLADERLIQTFLYDYAVNRIFDIESYLYEHERKWVDRFITSVDSTINEMEAQDCMKWKRETSELPNYLSEKVHQEYNQMNIMINNRLKDCRIQGVISLFNELTAEEKIICLEKLSSIFK